MGKKRNKRKVRKAAKEAKAKEEAAAEERNNILTADDEPRHISQLRSVASRYLDEMDSEGTAACSHGGDKLDYICHLFLSTFTDKFEEAMERSKLVAGSLIDARNATLDNFAPVWRDSAMMETVISINLSMGTNAIREGRYDIARLDAAFTRFFEQHIAIVLNETQALYNWPKIRDTCDADVHTLVKFFRHRIPCSCLDKKYEEVKSITKMGYCFNLQCKIPQGRVERSKTKYCSRCRCVTYCSRGCQKADWTTHKHGCDNDAEIIAIFEEKQQK